MLHIRTVDMSRFVFIARGALQPAVYSWLLFLVFALFFYALTASAPMLGEVTWGDAARVTTCMWTTAFGGRCALPGNAGHVQLMPLLLTGVVVYALYHILRHRVLHSWAEVGIAATVQAVAVGIIGLVMRVQGEWWIAVLGSAGLAALCAVVAGREYLFQSYRWWRELAAVLPRVRRLLILLTAYAVFLFLVAILLGFSRILAIHSSYLAGFWGGLGLVLIQILYVPTVVMWALNWLLGGGFAVGEGSYFSVFGTKLEPIPAIPMFGALPHTNAWAAALLLVVVAGVIWLAVRDTVRDLAGSALCDPAASALSAADTRKAALRSALIVVCTSAVVVALLTWLARGSLGSGRMGTVGTRADIALLAVLVSVGIPYILGALIGAKKVVKRSVVRAQEAVAPREHSATNSQESTIQDAKQPSIEHLPHGGSVESHNGDAESIEQGVIKESAAMPSEPTIPQGEEHEDAHSV